MKYKGYPIFWWGFPDALENIGLDFKREIEIITYVGNNLAYNPSSILFKERIITFYGPVFPDSANELKEKLLVLDKMPKDGEENQDITLYIDSPGGDLISLFGIYDTMQHIKSDINTVCSGLAASAASLMLTAGTKGKRYALPSSIVMTHELSFGYVGRHSDMQVRNNFAKQLENRLLDIYIKHARYDEAGEYVICYGGNSASLDVEDIKPTKMPPKEAREWLREWLRFDRWLNTEQAQALGIIDNIIDIKDLDKKK